MKKKRFSRNIGIRTEEASMTSEIGKRKERKLVWRRLDSREDGANCRTAFECF